MNSDQKSDRILCAIIAVILVIIFNGPSKHAHSPPPTQDAVFYLCDVDSTSTTHNSAGPSKPDAHLMSPHQDAVFYLCDVDSTSTTHNSAGVREEGLSTHEESMWEIDDDIKEEFTRSLDLNLLFFPVNIEKRKELICATKVGEPVPPGFYTDNKVVLVVILFRKQTHREAGLTSRHITRSMGALSGVCSTTTTAASPGIFSTTESMSCKIYL